MAIDTADKRLALIDLWPESDGVAFDNDDRLSLIDLWTEDTTPAPSGPTGAQRGFNISFRMGMGIK